MQKISVFFLQKYEFFFQTSKVFHGFQEEEREMISLHPFHQSSFSVVMTRTSSFITMHISRLTFTSR